MCNETFPVLPSPAPTPAPVPLPAASLYVDSKAGNDSAPGTKAQPLRTILAAVIKSRSLPRPAAVVLRGGVHRLNQTITLGPQDSGLRIVAYAADAAPAVITGAVQLPITAWKPLNVTLAQPPRWQMYNDTNQLEGVGGPGPNAINATQTDTPQGCQAVCQAWAGPGTCYSWTWHSPVYPLPWNRTCWVITVPTWAPTAEANHVSGRMVADAGQNVWVGSFAGPDGSSPLPAALADDPTWLPSLLLSADGGGISSSRGIRARFPNCNPEVDQYPTCWAPHAGSGGAYVKGPAPDLNSTEVVHTVIPGEEYPAGMFADYRWGYGGPCERFTATSPTGAANGSYWCQPGGRTQGADFFVNTPVGYAAGEGQLPNQPAWTDPVADGGIVAYWRQGHWFTMATRIAAYDAPSRTVTFGYGQFQGAEGEAVGEDFAIEHVKEELDAPSEFFLDVRNSQLRLYWNATPGTAPPAASNTGLSYEVPLLQRLFEVDGSMAAPVTDVSFEGITFTGAAPTYMAPHGLPSGGDWGLHPGGALTLTGTERVNVTGCTFSHVDGNAVVLLSYNRNASVSYSEFAWGGESAVAQWGSADGYDATGGDFPLGTSVAQNLCHDYGGPVEKQVSCVFTAVAAEMSVTDNIFYNGPRAHININDGLGGGHAIRRNLLWNSCRESQDHGPINSWSRVPYVTTLRNGTASTVGSYIDIGPGNFIVAGGGANGGSVDNDDGSSYYWTHDNFFVYGGHKSDFDGHGKHSVGNVMAYASVYGPKCFSLMQTPYAGGDGLPYAEGYSGNTCILATAGAPYLELGQRCVRDNSTGQLALWLGNNTVYAPGGAEGATVSCDGDMSAAQWLALGLDVGTRVEDSANLTAAQILGWASQLLGL